MLRVLFRPFAYLTIEHDDPIYRWINWWVPLFFSLLTSVAWGIPWLVDKSGFISPQSVDIWSESGLISKIQGFVQNLPGFYTAALAAVATFGGENMLRIMPGKAPRMRFLMEGALTEGLELNRRLFLSSMFAYLTALSFLLTVGAAVAISLAPALKPMVLPAVLPWISAAVAGLYALFFVQMLTVTGWGLYYLGERMHLADGPSGP